MIGEDEVQSGTGLRVVVVVPLGLIPATAVRYLFSCKTEEKEIFFARFFCHLNSRAIARADGQRPVHHELHVTGATGFVTGCRNLIGNIRNRTFSRPRTIGSVSIILARLLINLMITLAS